MGGLRCVPAADPSAVSRVRHTNRRIFLGPGGGKKCIVPIGCGTGGKGAPEGRERGRKENPFHVVVDPNGSLFRGELGSKPDFCAGK